MKTPKPYSLPSSFICTMLLSVVCPAAEITVTCQNNSGDAALIQTAINSSSPGDEIVITGTGSITSTIKLLGGRSYRGDGMALTILKQAPGSNLEAIVASDSWVDNWTSTGLPVTLRHLTIDGNKAANTTADTAGLILRSWLTTVEGIEIKQTRGDGLRLSNASKNGTNLGSSKTQVNGRIADCRFKDCGGNGILVRDSGAACTDWTLIGNEVRNSGGHGIYLEHSAGWYICENKVYDSGKSGIYAERAFATSIAGNMVTRSGRSAVSGWYYGIGATLQGDVGSTIMKNTVYFDALPGNTASIIRHIGIAKVNYGEGYASVVDNFTQQSVILANSTGLHYAKGSGASSFTISSTGNTVLGSATPRYVETGVTLGTGL